jgi:hypothetical protein
MKDKAEPLSPAYMRKRTRSYTVLGAIFLAAGSVLFAASIYCGVVFPEPDLLWALILLLSWQALGLCLLVRTRREAMLENEVILRALQDLKDKDGSQPTTPPYSENRGGSPHG